MSDQAGSRLPSDRWYLDNWDSVTDVSIRPPAAFRVPTG